MEAHAEFHVRRARRENETERRRGQQAGDAGDGVVDAGRRADVSGVDRAHHRCRQWRHAQGQAAGDDRERRQDGSHVRVRIGADAREEREAGGDDAGADRQKQSCAGALGKPPRAPVRSASRPAAREPRPIAIGSGSSAAPAAAAE